MHIFEKYKDVTNISANSSLNIQATTVTKHENHAKDEYISTNHFVENMIFNMRRKRNVFK